MERVIRLLFLILKTILRVLLRTEELGTYTVLLFPLLKISLQFLQESLENSVRRRRFCSPRRAPCAFFFFFFFIASFERRRIKALLFTFSRGCLKIRLGKHSFVPNGVQPQERRRSLLRRVLWSVHSTTRKNTTAL